MKRHVTVSQPRDGELRQNPCGCGGGDHGGHRRRRGRGGAGCSVRPRAQALSHSGWEPGKWSARVDWIPPEPETLKPIQTRLDPTTSSTPPFDSRASPLRRRIPLDPSRVATLQIWRFSPRFEMGEGEEAGGGGFGDGNAAAKDAPPPTRDIRRYKCEFCDVVRSKRRLIRAHVLEHHKNEVDDYIENGGGLPRKDTSHDCKECGLKFKKPAHLKQHMQSHSLEAIC